MAKRNRQTDQTVIDHRAHEGRGQGQGVNYQPWLRVQDVPSQGLASRIRGMKTGRVHHLFSTLETDYFYVLEWSLMVSDIREQFPLLPLEATLAIAEASGVLHPRDPKTRSPIVMTTDFVVTLDQNIASTIQARTVKPAKDLQNKRILEKLEIERQYWQSKNIDWGIVTEREIPTTLARNVAWFHPYFHSTALAPLSEREVRRASAALTKRVLEGTASLAEAAADCDDRLGLPAGASLSVARHLLASRQWPVDMNKPINPRERLYLTAPVMMESVENIGGRW